MYRHVVRNHIVTAKVTRTAEETYVVLAVPCQEVSIREELTLPNLYVLPYGSFSCEVNFAFVAL